MMKHLRLLIHSRKSLIGLPASAVFETDASPTASSTKAVQSGGVYTALAGKAASSHSHAQSDVTGLSDALAGKLAAPSGTGAAGQVPAKTSDGIAWSGVDDLTPARRDYTASTASSVSLSPAHAPLKVTVADNGSLTLQNGASGTTGVGYLELTVVLGSGATVTAGTGLTLVDALEAGATNNCVVRWDNGTAELFVWRAE